VTLSGSTLYGTTYQGGDSGYGVVYKLNTDGSNYTVLKHFTLSDGGYPYGGVTVSNSTLYGTTEQGGNPGYGVVYKLNADGTGYTVLKHFNLYSEGVYPRAGLTLSGDTLYGTTRSGGSSGYGVVYKLNTDGSGYTVLKRFTSSDGRSPYAGVTFSDGMIYGTTYQGGGVGSGVVFSLDFKPVIQGIWTAAGIVVIDFTTVVSDTPAMLSLVGSTNLATQPVTNVVPAIITQLGEGRFQAMSVLSGNQRYFRIKRK
jgi:uncharacterized repeat protein (TIGR03803 family)